MFRSEIKIPAATTNLRSACSHFDFLKLDVYCRCLQIATIELLCKGILRYPKSQVMSNLRRALVNRISRHSCFLLIAFSERWNNQISKSSFVGAQMTISVWPNVVKKILFINIWSKGVQSTYFPRNVGLLS